MMRKVIGVTLILLMLLSLPITASALGEATISVSSATAKSGENIELILSVSDNPGISGAGLSIAYDKTALRLTEIQSLVSGSFVPNLEESSFSWLKGKNVTGDFDLVKLCFTVKSSVAGEYEVSANLIGDNAANLINQDTAIVSARFMPGVVTVEKSVTPGPSTPPSSGSDAGSGSAPSDSDKPVTNPDGSTTTNTSTADGSSGSTTVKPDGSVEAEVKLSDKAIENAEANGESVQLPIAEVFAGSDSETAPVITIDTGSEQQVRVEIPVAEMNTSTVAVLVMPDGSEKIVKNSVPTEAGIEFAVSNGAVVKIVDREVYYGDVHAVGHWGQNAINFAASRELVRGVGGDSFSPNTTTTRGMVFAILARYADHDTTPDAGEQWYVPGTEWAKVNGVSDGTDPEGTVTREQIVTMLWRYAGSPTATGSYDDFADADEVSSWAAAAVRWAISTGLIQGRGANNIAPKASATRAEFTQMLYNFCRI